MRILHLTPELPYPTGSGGRAHEYFLCRRWVELGHQVLNISPVLPGEAQHAEALRSVGVENWTALRPGSHLLEATEGVLREPAVLGTAVVAPVRALEMRIFWTRLRGLIEAARRDWTPDVVVVGHDMAAAWAQGLWHSVPAVLTLHNLTWRWYLSRARRSAGLASLLLRTEALRYRRHVLGLLSHYRAATTLSTIEADELRRLTDLPIRVVPIGVDTQSLQPVPETSGTSRVLFAGTLGYQPNQEGVRWFVEQVWPGVRREIPEAEFEIAGRGAPPGLRALADHPGVVMKGEVPEMGPVYARSNVVVVPILSGAGVRVKVVEALASGRAIVSTSLGCEGLPGLRAREQLLVADSSDEFAAGTVHLLRDPGLRAKLAQAARALAEARFDWREVGDQYEELLRQVATHGSQPR